VDPEIGSKVTAPQSPETSTLPAKSTTAPAGLVAVTVTFEGHPNAHVAGAPPGEKISTSALEALLSERASFVSLFMFAVLETIVFGAELLTEKLRVMVATEPLAQFVIDGRTQSMTLSLVNEQVKAEVVVASM
jgi:hypothetical protein